MTRYAVYWAPEETHALWHAGSSWLGRDARLASQSRPLHEAAAEPSRYGFHATLKAPIALQRGCEPWQFFEATRSLAKRLERFETPALSLNWLKDFLVLQPAKPIEADHPLRRLADACVRELDEYRAPFDAGEFERRSTGLDGERRRLLSQWGYPHVFDRWRFHMTLSCGIRPTDHERRRSVLDAARTQFADALKCSIECDSLCVFVEGSPGEPFVLSDRFPLGR